jgi:ADP-ribose diphosphatase
MRDPKLPKILAERTVAKSRVFQIDEVDLGFSNGAVSTYERAVSRAIHSVMVIPLIDPNTVLLIREYAVGVDRYELALPKGVIENGEDPLAAAQREAMEEVGYAAKQLTLLKEVTAIPGYLTGSMFCVLAQDLYPATAEGDEPEPIEVVPYPLSDLNKLVMSSEMTEARSIAALFMTREYLAGKL